MAYHLKLPHWMKQLHPVFNIVKLTLALDDLITGQKMKDYLLLIVIDGEAEWEVEKILNSCWHWRRFQYLIKWKGYGREHNSWEFALEVSALELIAEFHCKYLGALRHIQRVYKKAKLQAGIKPTALCLAIDKENSIEFPLDSLHYLYNYYMVCALLSHAYHVTYHVTSCDMTL